jgi:hypothetical protein
VFFEGGLAGKPPFLAMRAWDATGTPQPRSRDTYGDPSLRMAQSVMRRASWPSQSIVHAIRSPLRIGPDSVGARLVPAGEDGGNGRTKP